MMFRRIGVVCVLAVLGACGDRDQRTGSLDAEGAMQLRENWSEAAVASLDAGNAAVRADSFALARTHFMAVTREDSAIAAGWFGLYLAESGLGNEEAAAEALDRARALAEGANLLHPEGRQ